ncbi:MAG TPA: M28 family peptidase [Actinomycetota bacterium]|nr:M28 family peptidase [Actinomycetota bacterium]
MQTIRKVALLVTSLAVLGAGVPSGQAQEPQALPLDLKKLTSFYAPRPDLADLNNWKTYNAYNTVHFVAERLPNRQPADTTTNDPFGDQPQCKVIGDIQDIGCQYNHQLEYLAWFEEAYGGLLKDFGVTFRTFEFISTGSGGGDNFSTNAGRAFNKFAVIPGADNPEDFVLIGSHYDGVDGSPYAAWDSTSGSGTMLRTAKLMADYWKATNTRPSKTVIFAAWDAEEAGGQGSKKYVGASKNSKTTQDGYLPKDPDVQLTSYVNHDPCGGHYPAFYRGSPVSRNPAVEKQGFIPMNIALHAPPTGSPSTPAERTHMTAFNASMRPLINSLFNELDDTLPFTGADQEPGVIPVFLSNEEATELGVAQLEQESVLKVTTKGLALFTTDAEDFPAWIPTLNPYPDLVGPHAVSTDPNDLGYGPDGLWAYHTPHDNWEQLVAQTSADQSGQTYSKGLSMSFELCSMLSAATMLQPTQGGSQVPDDKPVAWFDATGPNANGGTHVFDARGSYRYADPATRAFDDTLEFIWDFGDGTTATGATITHSFPSPKGYRVTLTVRDPETGMTDTMSQKIGVGAL